MAHLCPPIGLFTVPGHRRAGGGAGSLSGGGMAMAGKQAQRLGQQGVFGQPVRQAPGHGAHRRWIVLRGLERPGRIVVGRARHAAGGPAETGRDHAIARGETQHARVVSVLHRDTETSAFFVFKADFGVNFLAALPSFYGAVR